MFSFSYAVAQKNSKGTWNSTTATYRNDKYGVIWELPTELKWTNRPILTESTIFKVRNNDMLLTVSIRVVPYNGETVDIWSEECHIRGMSEMSTKEEAKM